MNREQSTEYGGEKVGVKIWKYSSFRDLILADLGMHVDFSTRLRRKSFALVEVP